MAATVIINEYNGAGGAKTDKTSGTVRFKNADDANVDLVDPLIVPASGQEYSFEKWLRLEITDAGGFTQIDNLRAYSDGSNDFGAGVKLWYAVSGSYMQPVVPDEANETPAHVSARAPRVSVLASRAAPAFECLETEVISNFYWPNRTDELCRSRSGLARDSCPAFPVEYCHEHLRWPKTRFKLELGDRMPKRRVEGMGDRNSRSAGPGERIAGILPGRRGSHLLLLNAGEAARGRLT